MTDAKTDGVNVVAVLVIASFAIDRIVAALLFMVGFAGPSARAWIAEPEAARQRKLVYFLLAGSLCAAVLLSLPDFRVLSGLGYRVNSLLDGLITALIVLGGSDRMSELVSKFPGGSVAPPPQRTIEVAGKLILEEPGKGP